MIHAWKAVGETPLEALQHYQTLPAFAHEKMSYAGRLDPMAEGILSLLVGEENKRYKDFLSGDKTYTATFLVGVSTDSGDVLGRHAKVQSLILSDDVIADVLQKIKHTKQQTYPWFSAQTYKGKKLFEYFKQGKTDIERPVRTITIHDVEHVATNLLSTEDVYTNILARITKVTGDFRQEEILADWKLLASEHAHAQWQVVTCSLHVSAGTYIRVLCDAFPVPVVLFQLTRTGVADR